MNTGFSDSLQIYYDPPMSNGGSEILRYRVELDPTSSFDNPIIEEFDCPSNNKRTVWKVEIKCNDNAIISGGTFSLELEGNGYNFITAKIPYDAVALSTNETGTKEFIQSSVQFSITNRNTSILSVPAINIESILFEGYHLRFSGQSSPFKYYTVVSVIRNVVTIFFLALEEFKNLLQDTMGGEVIHLLQEFVVNITRTYVIPLPFQIVEVYKTKLKL